MLTLSCLVCRQMTHLSQAIFIPKINTKRHWLQIYLARILKQVLRFFFLYCLRLACGFSPMCSQTETETSRVLVLSIPATKAFGWLWVSYVNKTGSTAESLMEVLRKAGYITFCVICKSLHFDVVFFYLSGSSFAPVFASQVDNDTVI